MKYISKEALEQVLDAYIEASKYRLEYYTVINDKLKYVGKIQEFEAVKTSLDSIIGIDSDKKEV